MIYRRCSKTAGVKALTQWAIVRSVAIYFQNTLARLGKREKKKGTALHARFKKRRKWIEKLLCGQVRRLHKLCHFFFRVF